MKREVLFRLQGPLRTNSARRACTVALVGLSLVTVFFLAGCRAEPTPAPNPPTSIAKVSPTPTPDAPPMPAPAPNAEPAPVPDAPTPTIDAVPTPTLDVPPAPTPALPTPTVNAVPTPAPVASAGPAPAPSGDPLTNLTAIGSGSDSTCALRENGSLICWGAVSREWTPPEDETFTDIQVGWFQLCALRRDGSSICWGIWGDDTGEVVSQEEPIGPRHPGFRRFLSRHFATVSFGGAGACAIRGEDGAALCWGDSETLPATAPAGQRFTAIRSGDILFACAFEKNNSPLCWEYNPAGLPPADELFAAISSGPGSTCAVLQADGSAVCWLHITAESSGDESFDPDAFTPPEGEKFTAISSGYLHACGLRQDGSLTCWGMTVFHLMVGEDERFTAIGNGPISGGACALREDQTLLCY